VADQGSAPLSVQVVTLPFLSAGTKTHPRRCNRHVGWRRGFAPTRRGFQIAAVTFPWGCGVNPVRPYRVCGTFG